MPPSSLSDLEVTLRNSHSEDGLRRIEEFSGSFAGTQARLSAFNVDRGLLRSPILQSDTEAYGFRLPEDAFMFLQGDVIRTDSGFFFGERVTGYPKYLVLNSSCDLVVNRRKCAALLRVVEIRGSDRDSASKLGLLLKFTRRDSMYLPCLPDDAADVLCNAVEFDGFCQIHLADLALANRVASLSLVGWRIFGSFARVVIARANPREVQMREALECSPSQRPLPYDEPQS
jgi:hypothetical protein